MTADFETNPVGTMARLKELEARLTSPTQQSERAVLPNGWTIKQVGQRLVVAHADYGGYAAHDRDDEDNIAAAILYYFARDLHAAVNERPNLLSRVEELTDALKAAKEELDALWSYYGQNLQVHGWHQNGNAEPLDHFFETNDYGAREGIRAALAE